METRGKPTHTSLHIAMLIRATTWHSMGGMELHAETLRRGLVISGHRVTTITTRLPSGPRVMEDQWGKIYFVGDGAPGQYGGEWWRESVRALLRIHADDPVTVIASQSKAARAYVVARSGLPALQQIPAVVIMHSASVDELRSHLRQVFRHPARAALRWLPRDLAGWRDDRRWLYLADHITVLSQAAARSMSRWLRVPASSVTAIPNGVDVEGIAAAAENRAETRQQLGITDDVTAVLVLASLVRRKGQHHMLDALATPCLRKYGRSLRLVLAGEGPTHAMLQRQCAILGLTEQVIFTGNVPRERVPALLSAADIVALPSDDEGMPLSLLEAMAAGHPVVASRVGAIPEIVEDNISGMLVAPGSPDALAHAIDALIHDPGNATLLGVVGRERVRAQYDQRAMITAYERVLRDTAMSWKPPDREATALR